MLSSECSGKVSSCVFSGIEGQRLGEWGLGPKGLGAFGDLTVDSSQGLLESRVKVKSVLCGRICCVKQGTRCTWAQLSAEGDFFISHFLYSFSGPPAIPCEKDVAGNWSRAGPLLGVGRGPDLPERIGPERIGSQWGKGSSCNHKYKFYSRSLSPFVFLGGLRAMSALCMSNSRSAPPGCMMDGSGKAGLGSCLSPLQSLRPHPPQSLRPSSLPTFSLHSAEALSSQFSIHPRSPSPHHPLFDSLTSVPFRCQVSSLEHLLLLSPG